MIDFLGQKKNETKSKYINLILKTNLGRENNEYNYANDNNNIFLGLYHYNSNFESFNSVVDEENDFKQKINSFSEYLITFPFNFGILIQLYELIENYFCDDVIIVKKNIDLSFVNKIMEIFQEDEVYQNYIIERNVLNSIDQVQETVFSREKKFHFVKYYVGVC